MGEGREVRGASWTRCGFIYKLEDRAINRAFLLRAFPNFPAIFGAPNLEIVSGARRHVFPDRLLAVSAPHHIWSILQEWFLLAYVCSELQYLRTFWAEHLDVHGGLQGQRQWGQVELENSSSNCEIWGRKRPVAKTL